MKGVLLYKRYAHQPHNRHSQHCKENGIKCTHKRLNYSLVPPFWEVFELLNIITNARNLFCCVGMVPKFVPQPVI
jgi:hypothetical protein